MSINYNNQIDRSKMLMGYNTQKTLNENLNAHVNLFDESIVITEWLSPDEKFVIFLDELFDVEKKLKIGNIWENFDNFKFFLKHSFEVSKNISQGIKESVLTSINSLVITESTQDARFLKPIVKKMIQEGFWDSIGSGIKDFGGWVVDQGKSAAKGISDFAKTSYEGGKEFVGAISKGDWDSALEIIGKGILYVARKIRSAMYHPVGLILDAILVATGIGKSIQWIPWAIIVALDVYEFMSGNYEEENPMWMRILFFGVDILGLVLAGVAAKSAKVAITTATTGIKTEAGMAKVISKNPELRGTLESMVSGTKEVPNFLRRAVDYLKTKFPSAAKFIESILGGLERFITKVINSLKSLLSPKGKVAKGALAGATTAGITYGIEKGVEKLNKSQEPVNGLSPEDFSSEDVDLFLSGKADYGL
jgi:hypothetical protein